MRVPPALPALVLLGVLAAAGSADPLHGTSLNGGDRVTGAVDSAADRDLFRVHVPRGARLQVEVKAAKKSPFLPDVALYSPAGSPVDLTLYASGQSTPVVTIPDFVSDATGEWTVAVHGYLGSTGAYQLAVKVLAATKIRTSVVVPAGSTLVHPFVGVAGARVDYSLAVTSGPALASAALSDPDGLPVAGSDGVPSRTKFQGRKITLAGGDGLYGLEMSNAGAAPANVDVTVAVKFPRVKARKIALGTEPRPATVSPVSGRDGTPFTITGSGFAEGARVVFADLYDADGVERISESEIRGFAPECAASREGVSAPVSVLNPDGQYGSTAGKFTFIGIPGPVVFGPKYSPVQGGILVTVSGSRFRSGYSVEVGGIPATTVSVLSATTLTFVTPPGPAGVHDVVVKDEFGRAAAPLPGLWYSATPTLASASPSTLPSYGGATVTLSGTGLVPETRVFVGGTEAVVTARTPPSSLAFLCPPGLSGAVAVEVRDPLARSATGSLLTMTRSLVDVSATALPAGPEGADFRGHAAGLWDATGDGRPEILVTSRARWNHPVYGHFMPALFLLRNLGTGTFADATDQLPSFGSPSDDGQGDETLLGDLDGNGRMDAVLVRAAPLPADSPSVSFQGFTAFYDINYPATIDADTAPATRLLVNTGGGQFSDRSSTNLPAKASTPAFGKGERWQGGGAALGDLDGDSDADVVLAARDDLVTGTISKVKWTYTYFYYYGYKYKVKDKALLSQAETPRGCLRVLRNAGNGNFSHGASDLVAPAFSGAGVLLDDFRGEAVAVADLTGDGKRDIVLVGPLAVKAEAAGGALVPSPALRILVNTGAGQFQNSLASVPAALAVSRPESEDWWQGTTVATGDFDGDGDSDIAVGRESIRTYIDSASGQKKVVPALRLFRNGGTGVFTEDTAGFLAADLGATPSLKTILSVNAMAVADIDGDGDPDLLLAGRKTTPSDPAIPGGARMAVRVLVNGGAGGMTDATAQWLLPTDFLPSDGVAAGDIDGDGRTDVVVVLHGDPGGGRRSLRVLSSR